MPVAYFSPEQIKEIIDEASKTGHVATLASWLEMTGFAPADDMSLKVGDTGLQLLYYGCAMPP